jgi:phage terminase small subunit
MNKKLTRKQKAFADTLLNNPKISGTQAALQTYGKPDKPATYGTAQQLAYDNLMKPNIQIYMEEHVDKAKNKIVTLVNSDREEIALNASKDILDRVHGKATQRIEQHSTSVNLNLSLQDVVD